MAGVKDTPLQPMGYQQLAVGASAVSLTIPKGSKRALIQAETATVRYRDDGTDPTSSIGMVLMNTGATAGSGYVALWYTGKLEKLRFIQGTAAATLNVLYYA